MLSISDSTARKNKLFPELTALSTRSLSRKCLSLHQKLWLLCSLHGPDTDPIKKATTSVFSGEIFSLFSSIQHVHIHLGCYCMIPTHFQKTLLDKGFHSNTIAFTNKPQINTQNILFTVSSSIQELYDCLFCLRAAHAQHILAKLLQIIS